MKIKSQTDSITKAPKGQTSLGEIGELGNLLPIYIDAMPIRPIFPHIKWIEDSPFPLYLLPSREGIFGYPAVSAAGFFSTCKKYLTGYFFWAINCRKINLKPKPNVKG